MTTDYGLLGGAVNDLFGGVAGLSEGAAYSKASQLASQNAQLAGVSTKLAETQAAREAYKTISGQKAEVSGAGFAAGGSAGDLLRSSAQQSAQTQGALQLQGAITQTGFEQQSAAYQGQAAAAKAKGAGGILSGVIQAAGFIAML